jgi:hypothetical protein
MYRQITEVQLEVIFSFASSSIVNFMPVPIFNMHVSLTSPIPFSAH